MPKTDIHASNFGEAEDSTSFTLITSNDAKSPTYKANCKNNSVLFTDVIWSTNDTLRLRRSDASGEVHYSIYQIISTDEEDISNKCLHVDFGGSTVFSANFEVNKNTNFPILPSESGAFTTTVEEWVNEGLLAFDVGKLTVTQDCKISRISLKIQPTSKNIITGSRSATKEQTDRPDIDAVQFCFVTMQNDSSSKETTNPAPFGPGNRAIKQGRYQLFALIPCADPTKTISKDFQIQSKPVLKIAMEIKSKASESWKDEKKTKLSVITDKIIPFKFAGLHLTALREQKGADWCIIAKKNDILIHLYLEYLEKSSSEFDPVPSTITDSLKNNGAMDESIPVKFTPNGEKKNRSFKTELCKLAKLIKDQCSPKEDGHTRMSMSFAGIKNDITIELNLTYLSGFESSLVFDVGASGHTAMFRENDIQTMLAWSEDKQQENGEIISSITTFGEGKLNSASKAQQQGPNKYAESYSKLVGRDCSMHELADGSTAPNERDKDIARQIDFGKYLFWNMGAKSPGGVDAIKLNNEVMYSLGSRAWATLKSRIEKLLVQSVSVEKDKTEKDWIIKALFQPVQLVFTHPACVPIERYVLFKDAAVQVAKEFNLVRSIMFQNNGAELCEKLGINASDYDFEAKYIDGYYAPVVTVPEPLAAAALKVDEWAKNATVGAKARFIALDIGKQTFDICIADATKHHNSEIDGVNKQTKSTQSDNYWSWKIHRCFGAPLGGQVVDFFLMRAFAEIMGKKIDNKFFKPVTLAAEESEIKILELLPDRFDKLGGWEVLANNRFAPPGAKTSKITGSNKKGDDFYGRCLSILRQFENAKLNAAKPEDNFRLILWQVNWEKRSIFNKEFCIFLNDNNIANFDALENKCEFICTIDELISTKAFKYYLELIAEIVKQSCRVGEAQAENTKIEQFFVASGRALKFAPIRMAIENIVGGDIDVNFSDDKLCVAKGAGRLALQPHLTKFKSPMSFYAVWFAKDSNKEIVPQNVGMLNFPDQDREGEEYHIEIEAPENSVAVAFCPGGPGFCEVIEKISENYSASDCIAELFHRFLRGQYKFSIEGDGARKINITKIVDAKYIGFDVNINTEQYDLKFPREGVLLDF